MEEKLVKSVGVRFPLLFGPLQQSSTVYSLAWLARPLGLAGWPSASGLVGLPSCQTTIPYSGKSNWMNNESGSSQSASFRFSPLSASEADFAEVPMGRSKQIDRDWFFPNYLPRFEVFLPTVFKTNSGSSETARMRATETILVLRDRDV